jgi:ribosomal protein S18 acetylase RimI-like enzyme
VKRETTLGVPVVYHAHANECELKVTACTVRPARPQDADAIGSMVAEFQGYLRSLGDQAEFDFNSAKYLRDGFGERPWFDGLIAENPTGIVGYLLYHFGYDTDFGRGIVHIVDLYVREVARGQGIGRALMDRVAEIGSERGAAAMFWSVYKPNLLAAGFYEKIGAHYINDLHFMSLET